MRAKILFKRLWVPWNAPSDIPILAGALLLALSGMTTYWYDEAFTALLSRLPTLADAIRATALDVHPPLHYIITWLLAHSLPGHEEFVTRGISAVFQILALITFWHILGLLNLDRKVKVWSLALMAFAPVQLVYGSEGRMYALLQLLVMVQVWSMLSRRWWVLGLSTIAALYTHNYGVFYTVVIGLIALARELTITCVHIPLIPDYFPDQPARPKADFKGLILALVLPVLAFLPWVFYALIPQMSYVGSGQHWIRPFTAGQALWDLFLIVQTSNYPKVLAAAAFVLVSSGLVLVFISAVRHKHFLLMALALGPWALACLASWLIMPVLLFRGLLPSTPFIFALIVLAISQNPDPDQVHIGKVIVASCLLLGIFGLASDVNSGVVHGKTVDPTFVFPTGSQVIFTEDTTLVMFSAYPQYKVQFDFLDLGCGEQLGALGSPLRNQMGFTTIFPAQLHESYYVVGIVSALANKCQEDKFTDLTALAQPLVELRDQFGVSGIYYVNHSH